MVSDELACGDVLTRDFPSLLAIDPAVVQAWSAVVVAILTLALVGVTSAYVLLTRSLVQAAQNIEFDVVVLGYYWTGHPQAGTPDGRLGPFPRALRITNRGTPVFVDAVQYDATRAEANRVPGQLGPVDSIDPPAPVLVYRSGVIYCGFEGGSWALAEGQEEVAVDITFRRRKRAKPETYSARAHFSVTEEPWGMGGSTG
jgi:hypothetical protein